MEQFFSRRTGWDTTEGELAQAIRAAQAAGRELIDLTLSNPTRCGFRFDEQAILGALQAPEAMVYDPDTCGIEAARQAVAGYYRHHHAEVDPGQILLTTSTSEAYSFLLRLLCNAGDAILAARPSYPLFDFLCDLDDVQLTSYPLFHDFGWWIDEAELERQITPRTRAVILVHPNNPTGHATGAEERARLQSLCARHGLALIVDEVFLDYGVTGEIASFARGPHPCLTFVVSGISKIAALPQMKVAWLACFGPEGPRAEALRRLEVVSDTFLSMNAPSQYALPRWLEGRGQQVEQIRSRVRANLRTLQAHAGEHLELLSVEAGWSAVAGVRPWSGTGEAALALLHATGVITHPGSFYGFAGSRWIVLSLIVPEERFAEGLQKLKQWCESR